MSDIERTRTGELQVATVLFDFINNEVLPGTNCVPDVFWAGYEAIIAELAPRNRVLLAKRDELQSKIDAWHLEHRNGVFDFEAYKAFLSEIGYMVPEGEAFSITTANVDPEISSIAGPQLVVPIMNARYALNAANARWGSLYDALYGTDVISEEDSAQKGPGFNPARGAKVVAWARRFLDQSAPLTTGGWADIVTISVGDGGLAIATDEGSTGLSNPSQFAGYKGDPSAPSAILLEKNGLHLEIVINHDHRIGKDDKAGIADIILEAALSTIMDCEDSVAAVDAEDKVVVYRNWLGLMKGDLEQDLEKGGKTITRRLIPDRNYTAPDGCNLTLHGRALMLVRNVGLLMTNSAILDKEGREIPETLMDGVINPLIALHDVGQNGRRSNSRAGSVYTVNPKMHGPDEVTLINDLFGRVEQLLRLPANTIKMGIMDEERRTTVNLKECIRAAKNRVFFVNTG